MASNLYWSDQEGIYAQRTNFGLAKQTEIHIVLQNGPSQHLQNIVVSPSYLPIVTLTSQPLLAQERTLDSHESQEKPLT